MLAGAMCATSVDEYRVARATGGAERYGRRDGNAPSAAHARTG